MEPLKTNRVILIVLDGVGCGELPDASKYNDTGSNTLGHVSELASKLKLPNLARWGVGNLTPMKTVKPKTTEKCVASFGKALERSNGKDTTSGHWEMAGIIVEKPFATFPDGFPKEIIDRWVKACHLPGYLGNVAASGTEIIKQLGEEHLKTLKPIVYTSADSVWQIAAHEQVFGLDKLLEISKTAREICDELGVSRVIARPFIGTSPSNFSRTHHRKDFAVPPPQKTMMEILIEQGFSTTGVGKIYNIYHGSGIQKNLETKNNKDGLETLLKLMNTQKSGLIFVNLIDFDMLYGHRRDVEGFAKSLMEFDRYLKKIEQQATPEDLILISADHGNDPSYRGTDHTREFVPILSFQKGKPSRDLGTRKSFADIGQTILHALSGKKHLMEAGTSFYEPS